MNATATKTQVYHIRHLGSANTFCGKDAATEYDHLESDKHDDWCRPDGTWMVCCTGCLSILDRIDVPRRRAPIDSGATAAALQSACECTLRVLIDAIDFLRNGTPIRQGSDVHVDMAACRDQVRAALSMLAPAMSQPDSSFPRKMAERRLGARFGVLSLDDLAEKLSCIETEGPVSVRDEKSRQHSDVYFCGKKTGRQPYLLKGQSK